MIERTRTHAGGSMKTGWLGFEPVCSARSGVQVHVLAGGLILEESGKEVSVKSPKPF